MAARRLRRLAGTTVGCAVAGMALAAAPALGASTVNYFPSSFGSSVNVTGEANDDIIDISLSGDTITITDTGTGGITTAAAPYCAVVNATTVTCVLDPPDPAPPADPNAPVVAAGGSLQGANDSFSITAPFRVELEGGEGDDTLTGGALDDFLGGDNGNDTVLGGDGDDFLEGGGTDFTTGGTDVLDGQGGVDFASFFRQLPVNVSLDGQPNDGFPGEGDNAIVEQVEGGEADDVLTGNAQANFLDGNDGNDLLTGLEGNDFMDGDDGDDGLVGGPQKDQFECDDNFDTAIVDPREVAGKTFDAECERTGAEPEGGTAIVSIKRAGGATSAGLASGKATAKVPVECPLQEANPCGGRLVLLAGQRKLGSGAFNVGPGATAKATVKLTKKGKKALTASGGTLLANAQAQTTEPIGTSVKQADVLLKTKQPRKKGGGR